MALSNVPVKDAAGNTKKVSANIHTTDEYAQIAQVAFSAEGDAPVPVSAANPLPVTAALSATDNAVLDAIQAAVEKVDDAISGSEMQVDVVGALPAGTNLIGKISTGQDSSTIYNGATALTPKRATISCSSSGANAIVSAVAGKKIRVLQCKFSANGTVNAKFQSASTDLEGLAYEIASSGYVLPFSPIGWFETAAGEALNLNLSAAIAVGGVLAYIEV